MLAQSPPCRSRWYLDVSAVGREVHLHHKAGDVPAAVDAVQLRAQRQVVEVDGALRGAHGQVARVWTEPKETEKKEVARGGGRV